MEIASFLIGLVATLAGGFFALWSVLRQRRVNPEAAEESPRERADRLARGLREAVELIEEFEAEIRRGQRTADRLQADIRRSEELVRLGRDDVEAVARVLRTELRDESGRSFRRDLALNGGFLVLGAGLSLLLTSVTGVG